MCEREHQRGSERVCVRESIKEGGSELSVCDREHQREVRRVYVGEHQRGSQELERSSERNPTIRSNAQTGSREERVRDRVAL